MSPKFWIIINYSASIVVREFAEKEDLNEFIMNLGSDVIQLEVISGFSLVKRRRDGE